MSYTTSQIKLCLFDQFYINMQSYFIAGNNSTGFRSGMPFQTKFFTVYFSVYAESCAGISPGILDDTTEFQVEFEGFCYIADSEIAV